MADKTINGLGEEVEFNEDTQRWEPVKSKSGKKAAETSQPAPDGETVTDEGDSTPRRARKSADDK